MAAVNTTAPPHASASLYAGNMSPDVTEAMLFEIFNQVGPVASIRVCRDAVTRRSLGYSYINFHNMVDAERALDTLNYTIIKGRSARIMWSQRDPALRKSGLGNIFIKNLDKGIDHKSLHDTFSAFGNILSCKVVCDENAVSRGYGFVHYENNDASDQAISKVNGMLLNGKKVFVGHHVGRKERESKSEELKKNFTNIFVKNLDETVQNEELHAIFSKFGTIQSCIVMLGDDGRSRGFGFVNFEGHEAAVKACEALNETMLKEKKVFVGRAQKKTERRDELAHKFEALKIERLNKYQGVNLYVKNLDDSVDDQKLREEFQVNGTITSAKIASDDKGNSKGFGFVCFSSPEEATKAVTEMNGRMLGSKPIYVALAQRKEIRRQQLEAQYAQRSQLRLAAQAGGQGGLVANPAMYGGAPMYYNIPPPARGGQNFPVYPMIPRPRWSQQGQQQARPAGYPQTGVNNAAYAPGTGDANYIGGANQPRVGGGRQGGRATRAGPNPQGPRPGGPGQVVQQPGQPGAIPQGQRKSYKYNANVRNREGTAAVPGAAPQAAAGGMPEAFTASNLSSLPPEQQKQILGERIFLLVQQREPDLAGKITGMMLEMDNSELIHLLESSDGVLLTSKIDQAVDVLRQHNSVADEAEEKKAE